MKIGVKIRSAEYWKSAHFFMKMFKLGMEHTWDTNFEMDVNQQILADKFNEMIPSMYAMIQWGINNEENVINHPAIFTRVGDNGEFYEEPPNPIVQKKLTEEEIKIGIEDILVDEEVEAYLLAHTVPTPNGNFKNIECGRMFFVYDTVSNDLSYF